MQLLDQQKNDTESDSSVDFKIISSFTNLNRESKYSHLQTSDNKQCCKTKHLLQNLSQKSMLDYENEFETINNLK